MFWNKLCLTNVTRKLSELEKRVRHTHVTVNLYEKIFARNQLGKWLISARNPWKLRWDLFVLAISLYSCILVPFLHAFLPEYTEEVWVLSLGYSSDFIFLADLLVNFRTTQITADGEEETDPRQITWLYLQSKFPVDVAAAVPMELLSSLFSGQHSLFYLMWMLRMLRLSRLGKAMYYLPTQETVKHSIKILHLLAILLVYIHIVACSWYSLISVEKSWTVAIGPEDLYGSSILSAYATLYYFSIHTILGSEVYPSTGAEYCFMSIALLLGSLLHSFILGEAVVIITEMNKETKRYNRAYDSIHRTSCDLGLSKPWRDKLMTFLMSSYGFITRVDKQEQLLERLPESLRRQVSFELYGGIFTNNFMFQQQPTLTFFAMYLLQYQCYLPEQSIVCQFARGDTMYFVSAGECQVYVTDHSGQVKPIRLLQQGDYFGELSLLFQTFRTATVTSRGFTNIAELSYEAFLFITRKYPSIHSELMEKAKKYKDPYTQFTLKTLRKISYFRHLDANTLQHAMYTFKRACYPPNSHLFQEGELATKAFIILQGQVSVGMVIKGQKVAVPNRRRSVRHQTKFSRSMQKSRPSPSASASFIAAPRMLFKFVLDELGPGSILASTHVVLGHIHSTSCKALVETNVLEFDLAALEKLNIRPLKVQINKTRARYMHFDRQRHEYISYFLPLDYTKGLNTTRSWQLLRRFKTAVIRKICFRRRNRLMHIQRFSSAINRIRAVLAAEKLSLGLLAHDISRGRIVPEVMEAVHLLYSRDLRVPLRAQLGVQMLNLRRWTFSTDRELQELHKQARQNTNRIIRLLDTFKCIQELWELVLKFKN